jgi:hypothetical protein
MQFHCWVFTAKEKKINLELQQEDCLDRQFLNCGRENTYFGE